MMKLFLSILALFVLSLFAAACGGATPETVVVKEEVIKEVPVEVVVKEEVIKEVQVPGETVVVKEEVIKEVKVPGETIVVTKEVPVEVTKEVVKTVEVEVPVEVVVEKEVSKFVDRKDTLIIGGSSTRSPAPDNYNAFVPGVELSSGFWQGVMESLFYYNYESGELEPWLAESYEFNADFSAVTLKTRQGVEWADGVPFGANDIAFTLNLLGSPEAEGLSWAADVKNSIKEVTVVDSRTVRLELNASNPRFVFDIFGVRILSSLFILPEHIWKDKDPFTFKNFDIAKGWPIGTGPYKLVSSTHEESVWDRRDDWWAVKTGFKTLPAPKRFIHRNVGGEEKRAAMITHDEIDTTWSVGIATLARIKEDNPNVLTWFEDVPFAYLDPCPRLLGLNNTVKPFDDREVRRAINHAINRDEIITIAYEGANLPSLHMFPVYRPLARFLDANEDLFSKFEIGVFDPQKTADIMTRKGFTKDGAGFWAGPDGKRVTLTMIIPEGSTEHVKMAPVVAEQLRTAGFDAAFKLETWGGIADATGLGTADSWLGWSCGSVRDPFRTLDNNHSRHSVPIGERAGGSHPGAARWQSSAFDAIVEEMAILPNDDPKMDTLFRQAMEIWLEELPLIPLVQAAIVIPFNSTYWTNWPTSDNNYVAPYWWWMSMLQILTELKPR